MKFAGLICAFSLVLFSCSKDPEGQIPNVPVNYRITLQEFQIRNKSNVLLVANQGVAGLIIYKRPDGAFTAFDRCSSVNPAKRCAVTPDETGLIASDTCSGAKFSLYDGAAVKAPAQWPLKQYQINVSNYDIRVIN